MSKNGANAQAVYWQQVYRFHLLKFMEQSMTADKSVMNVDGAKSVSERGHRLSNKFLSFLDLFKFGFKKFDSLATALTRTIVK